MEMRRLRMRSKGGVVFAGVVSLAGALGGSSTARAEAAAATGSVAWPGGPASVTEQTSYTAPNHLILGGGLVAFVGSYVPSVIVAATNEASYDKRLYIPVAGPWLTLAERPGCGASQADCSREAAFTALLIVDGLMQGLGVLATALGAVVPERRSRVVAASAEPAEKVERNRPRVHVVPARVGRDAYGIAATGTF
jgi:hypothetical protein